MDLYEAIYTTRAMRRMSAEPVPLDVLPKLFDAAIRGPNSGNTQLFRFIWVTEPDMKHQVQRIYRECLDELNATVYKGTMDSIAHGDPDDPNVRQSARIDKSSQWLGDNVHLAPMLIFVFGKAGGENNHVPLPLELVSGRPSRGARHGSDHAVEVAKATGRRSPRHAERLRMEHARHDPDRVPDRQVGRPETPAGPRGCLCGTVGRAGFLDGQRSAVGNGR